MIQKNVKVIKLFNILIGEINMKRLKRVIKLNVMISLMSILSINFSACSERMGNENLKIMCLQPKLVTLDIVPQLKIDLKNGKISEDDVIEIKRLVKQLRCNEEFYRLQNKNYERALKLNENMNDALLQKWN
jgi:hypothetical protein